MRRRASKSFTRAAGLGSVCALFLMVAPAASAHTTATLSDYGKATVNGSIGSNEYDSCIDTTQTAGGTSYPITVCEKNDETNDYYAVQVGDSTNDSKDSAVLWFDNDHNGLVQSSGSQCPYGQPDEDKIGWDAGFVDGFHCIASDGPWANDDFSMDGSGQKTFASGKQTFEFSHPLDSGDPDDYSLVNHSTVGWCMTYNDKSNPQPFNPGFAYGQVQFPPNCFVDFSNPSLGLVKGDATLFADVFKRDALDELLDKLKAKLKHLVAACKICPPDPTKLLLEEIKAAIKFAKKEKEAKTLKALKSFKSVAKDLPAGKGRKKLLTEIGSEISLVKHSKNFRSRPTAVINGAVHTHPTRIPPNGGTP